MLPGVGGFASRVAGHATRYARTGAVTPSIESHNMNAVSPVCR